LRPASVGRCLRKQIPVAVHSCTNTHDVVVEWGEYEVEAMSPAGEDVEIEIDPVTGAILEIDEDFF